MQWSAATRSSGNAEEAQDAVGPRVPVKLIDGVNHMAIVSDPAAVSAIADDVAKAGSGS